MGYRLYLFDAAKAGGSVEKLQSLTISRGRPLAEGSLIQFTQMTVVSDKSDIAYVPTSSGSSSTRPPVSDTTTSDYQEVNPGTGVSFPVAAVFTLLLATSVMGVFLNRRQSRKEHLSDNRKG